MWDFSNLLLIIMPPFTFCFHSEEMKLLASEEEEDDFEPPAN